MRQNQFLYAGNVRLMEQQDLRSDIFRTRPNEIYPWWLKFCVVKVLLVADGGLDFGMGDFGLSTFVSILQNDNRNYVRFEITLAHLSESVNNAQVQQGVAGIARSIKGFRFDNNSHFTPTMYDQVWLFGIETDFHRTTFGGTPIYSHRHANSGTYPAGRLSNAELTNLSQFMNGGGGVFATGDHGALGKSLCGSITRVRSMRRWDSTSGNNNLDEVSMSGRRRNDTTRIGHDPGSQFDDQSDDVPQPIQPKLYQRRLSALFSEYFPHPVLCSPLGRIEVLPDHPHEGECIEPDDLTQTYSFDGTTEYPTDSGGRRISPEVIATSTVLAGATAGGSKQATQSHSFGAISAYDGHRVGIGRVVTDATWHHFVNVNLVGELSDFEGNRGAGEDGSKIHGFLASPAGEAVFEYIKHYYVNIGVWISPPAKHDCFNSKLIWFLAYQHRILEAAMINPDLTLERLTPSVLYTIGTHATDVLGRKTGRCRSLKFMLDILKLPLLIERFDPWFPLPEPEPDPPLPWFNLTPLLNVALGAGFLALRKEFPLAFEEVNDKIVKKGREIFDSGLKKGLEIGFKSLDAEQKQFTSFLKQIR